MQQIEITANEFRLISKFLYDQTGINLGPEKKMLVTSRLAKRLKYHALTSYLDYYHLVMASLADGERQTAIDLLTTNETYFFREPKHFSFLEHQILKQWKGGKTLRVWSAASSSGEEAYSIAMLLDDKAGVHPWSVFGSDISTRVLEKARAGHYSLDRTEGIPESYLKKYCLKGTREFEGTLLIDKKLRQRVSFEAINLKKSFDKIGLFDIIFLRNVLIYFDKETKQQIVKNIISTMEPEGYLFIGHSESLTGINSGLTAVAPTIYQNK
jgi:chemotaxis protein methyltransferase CheR